MNQARVWGMVLALGAARALGAQDVGLAVGQKAPAAVVQDLDGKTVDLGRFIGHRPLLVEFWATWCPLCKALEPTLKSAHARYGRQVEFLAIGVGVNESPGSIRRLSFRGTARCVASRARARCGNISCTCATRPGARSTVA